MKYHKGVSILTDSQGNELPTLPFIGPMQPWINLVHTVGMPWVIIVLSAYYGIPFAKDISNVAEAMKNNLIKINGTLESNHEMLKNIREGNSKAAAERHKDFKEFKETAGAAQ